MTWDNKRKANSYVKMFYVIGLGLGGAEDITVKGLEIVKRAERVYLEAYTSVLTVGKEVLVRLCLRISGYLKRTVKMPNVDCHACCVSGHIFNA